MAGKGVSIKRNTNCLGLNDWSSFSENKMLVGASILIRFFLYFRDLISGISCQSVRLHVGNLKLTKTLKP